MKKILIIAGILVLTSCITEDKSTSKEAKALVQKEEQFQGFLEQFSTLIFPVKIKACDDDFRDLVTLDTTVSAPFEKQPYYVYGQLKTNDAYIAILTMGAADCFLPILTTYKPNGESISTETLAFGRCGSGPCFECEEFMEIDSELNIYMAFTSRYYDCDEEGMEISGTAEQTTIYRIGKITEAGKIELSSEFSKKGEGLAKPAIEVEPPSKDNNTLAIHGVMDKEQLARYYPKITDSIQDLAIVASESIEMNPNTDVHVSLLHNTRIFDQMILCTHDKDMNLIDHFYIGKATMFDVSSHTIEYKLIDAHRIQFNHVDWAYVESEEDHEIAPINTEIYILNIDAQGRIKKE